MPGTARPSRKIPAASPPSPSLQVPYPGKSAFYARPSNVPLQARLPFGPSPCKQVSLLALDGRNSIDYYGLSLRTLGRCADFCAVVRRPLGPLSPFKDTTQTSPGKYVDFPCTPASFTVLAFDRMGLRCYMPTRPASQPLMMFVSLRSQICLRLPSDPASRRRPCLTVPAAQRSGVS